jgi:hypothetical protein
VTSAFYFESFFTAPLAFGLAIIVRLLWLLAILGLGWSHSFPASNIAEWLENHPKAALITRKFSAGQPSSADIAAQNAP